MFLCRSSFVVVYDTVVLVGSNKTGSSVDSPLWLLSTCVTVSSDEVVLVSVEETTCSSGDESMVWNK